MTISLRWTMACSLALVAGGGCSSDPSPGNEVDASSGTGISPITSTDGSGTTSGSTVGTSAETSASTTGPSADSASSEGSTGMNDPGNPLDCGGHIYQCGDMVDNDGDGNIDLLDPECIGPCDDDESSFQTGLPGDNMDCKQDCFFDGNSGQGNDGCIWDLTCDPANPGANVSCEYDGGNNCDNIPPNQDPGCIEICAPSVPPGCDCFGCCTVQLPDGTSIDIYLGSGDECSLDNLDGCSTCTSQIDDCGVPCVPEKCQVCFGEEEPPEGCGGEQTCPSGDTCDADMPDSCPPDYFCYLGCCYPPPPG